MCGSDVFTGSEIWKRYREFEVDEHEELLDMQAAATDIQKSKERFIKVYLRQLSLPLVGNEETLKEFEEKLGEFCVESDAALIQPAELEKKIAAAREQRESRLIYEMHLLSDKYSSSGVAEKELFWQGYVAFEKKQSQLSRMQRLYERAVMECPQSTQLWLEFTDFALATLKNWQLLSSVTRRAVKVHRNSLFLWKLRLLSMECTNEAPDNIQLEFQRAVSFGLAGVDEYLELYLAYCDYQRRALYVCYNKHQSGGNSNRQEPTSAGEVAEKLTAQVQQMQAALQQVQVFLTSYGAQWPAGWWKLCKYQAQVETSLLCPVQDFVSTLLTTAAAAGTSEDAPAVQFTGKSAVSSKKAKTVKLLPGSEIWETATKLFPGTFFLWSEYILWAKNTGEYEHCRKLYRKLTNLHLDVSAEEVCQQWVQFEQQYGSVADLQVALIRAYPHAQSTILASAAKTVGNTETEAEAAAGQVAAVSSPAASTSEAMQVVDQDQGQAGSSTSNGRGAGDMKRKRSSSPSREEGRTTSSSDSALAQGSAKKVKFVAAADPPAAVVANFGANSASTAPSPHPPSVVPLSDTTVVVSNFPFAASLETVRPLLEDKCRLSGADLSAAGISPEQCKVVDMRLVLSKAGHSRGMVEIEFAPIVCTSTSAGSTSTNTKEGAALQHSVLQLAVQALNGATYNDRALRAEIKPLPVPVPIDGLTGPTGKGRGVKVDPLVAQQRAGSVAAPHLTTVFVSHLSKSVGNAELTAHFASCGDILAAKVAVDKKTKESKVYIAIVSRYYFFLLC